VGRKTLVGLGRFGIWLPLVLELGAEQIRLFVIIEKGY
jgi:hypothetical protein